jgi:hypothetical protein
MGMRWLPLRCTLRPLGKVEEAKSILRTPLCELLGIEHPVIQASIGSWSSAELVAAVSNAGGLGSVGTSLCARTGEGGGGGLKDGCQPSPIAGERSFLDYID